MKYPGKLVLELKRPSSRFEMWALGKKVRDGGLDVCMCVGPS